MTGRVLLRTPLMKRVTTTSSNETLKENSALPSTASRIWGKVTRKNVRGGLPPRLREASSRVGSSPWRALPTSTTTNGNASTLWASTRPPSVPTRPVLENTK